MLSGATFADLSVNFICHIPELCSQFVHAQMNRFIDRFRLFFPRSHCSFDQSDNSRISFSISCIFLPKRLFAASIEIPIAPPFLSNLELDTALDDVQVHVG